MKILNHENALSVYSLSPFQIITGNASQTNIAVQSCSLIAKPAFSSGITSHMSYRKPCKIVASSYFDLNVIEHLRQSKYHAKLLLTSGKQQLLKVVCNTQTFVWKILSNFIS